MVWIFIAECPAFPSAGQPPLINWQKINDTLAG
jgi:hypothetical protein